MVTIANHKFFSNTLDKQIAQRILDNYDLKNAQDV